MLNKFPRENPKEIKETSGEIEEIPEGFSTGIEEHLIRESLEYFLKKKLEKPF